MNKITKWRIEKRMTKTELAEKSGLSRQSIHTMETNINSATVKNLLKIAKALEVTIHEIL